MKAGIFLRSMGVEPTRLAAQEPKSCMSANFIMTARINKNKTLSNQLTLTHSV